MLEESGLIDMWKAEGTADAAGRLENLKEFVRSMGDFPTLAAFLEHVSLVMEVEGDEGGERVSIMTLHAAKGLEFDTVFLPGWEEGLFPHQRALDENGRAGLEEERRLAYVGITRARRTVKIYFAANRRVRGLWQSSISFAVHRRTAGGSRRRRRSVRARMAATAWRVSSASRRSRRVTRRRAGGARRESAAAERRLSGDDAAGFIEAHAVSRRRRVLASPPERASPTSNSAPEPSSRSTAPSSWSTSIAPAARWCSTVSSARRGEALFRQARERLGAGGGGLGEGGGGVK